MNRDRLTLPAATVVLYAVSYPLGAVALDFVSPFLLILLRFAFTAIVLWSLVAIRRAAIPRGRPLAVSVVGGLLVQAVQFLCLYWGMSHGVSPAIGALVIAMNPLATAVMGRVFLGHREDGWGRLALAVGVVGIALACVPRVMADPALGWGIIATLIALIGLSSGSICQSRVHGGVDAMVFTAIGVTASIPVAALVSLTTPQHVVRPLRATGLLIILVIASALATTLYASCVRRTGPRSAAILFALIPAVTSIASWAVLGERLTASTFIALACGALACLAQAHSAPIGATLPIGSRDRSTQRRRGPCQRFRWQETPSQRRADRI